eukprot:CAMPEP_0202898102 /NCGR_PEP_ID=MMETSP1392-20130828/6702_1 /ASSEMBLY_ACC=CAM_ASM_000868 /TAXON_ID=225041 /ORGANISM="Chlamydomonas chlamydogama, Strain SAG 11-48b" /LENGTH=201 /DNA_ID=CAMNT_0049583943 /DNA_START=202 /DNA_END=807 /DNA_ORIENTATION=+
MGDQNIVSVKVFDSKGYLITPDAYKFTVEDNKIEVAALYKYFGSNLRHREPTGVVIRPDAAGVLSNVPFPANSEVFVYKFNPIEEEAETGSWHSRFLNFHTMAQGLPWCHNAVLMICLGLLWFAVDKNIMKCFQKDLGCARWPLLIAGGWTLLQAINYFGSALLCVPIHHNVPVYASALCMGLKAASVFLGKRLGEGYARM